MGVEGLGGFDKAAAAGDRHISALRLLLPRAWPGSCLGRGLILGQALTSQLSVWGRQGCDAGSQFTRQMEKPEEEEKGFLHVFSILCLPCGPEFQDPKATIVCLSSELQLMDSNAPVRISY